MSHIQMKHYDNYFPCSFNKKCLVCYFLNSMIFKLTPSCFAVKKFKQEAVKMKWRDKDRYSYTKILLSSVGFKRPHYAF